MALLLAQNSALLMMWRPCFLRAKLARPVVLLYVFAYVAALRRMMRSQAVMQQLSSDLGSVLAGSTVKTLATSRFHLISGTDDDETFNSACHSDDHSDCNPAGKQLTDQVSLHCRWYKSHVVEHAECLQLCGHPARSSQQVLLEVPFYSRSFCPPRGLDISLLWVDGCVERAVRPDCLHLCPVIHFSPA